MNVSTLVKLKTPISNLPIGSIGVVLSSDAGKVAVFEGGLQVHCNSGSSALEVVGIAPRFSSSPLQFENMYRKVTSEGVGRVVHCVAWVIEDGGVEWATDSEKAVTFFEDKKKEVLNDDSYNSEVGLFLYGFDAEIDSREIAGEIDSNIWSFGIDEISNQYAISPRNIDESFEFFEGKHSDVSLVDVSVVSDTPIRRAVHKKDIENGDMFNVYYGKSSKCGAIWKNSLEESLTGCEAYKLAAIEDAYCLLYIERNTNFYAKTSLCGPFFVSTEELAYEKLFEYVSSLIVSEFPQFFLEYANEAFDVIDLETLDLEQGDSEDAMSALFILEGSYKKEIVDWYFTNQAKDTSVEAWYSITPIALS